MEKPKWTFWPTQYFFPHPVESSAYHALHTVLGTTVIQLNCSLCWGLFIYFLDDSLIPTVVSIQGMDVRCSATFPVGDGHLPAGQWESHSWTQLAGFCCCQDASNLGCHSWRVKWEMPWHPALRFSLQPQLSWSNLLLHSRRGNREFWPGLL